MSENPEPISRRIIEALCKPPAPDAVHCEGEQMIKPLRGSHCKHLGGVCGTITAIKSGLGRYEITWDDGKVETYSQKEFDKWCRLTDNHISEVSGMIQFSLFQDEQ